MRNIGSIPIFAKKQQKLRYQEKRSNDDYANIQIHLRNIFDNNRYYQLLNDNVSIYLNPYCFQRYSKNDYNNGYLLQLLKNIKSLVNKDKNPNNALLNEGANAATAYI